MNILNSLINEYGVTLLGAILTGIATYLGIYVKKIATKYINTKIKKEVAQTVVRGIQQCYNNLSGPEKLEKAIENATQMLAEQEITVTELELKMLLESAVGEFKDVFNQTSTETTDDISEQTEE